MGEKLLWLVFENNIYHILFPYYPGEYRWEQNFKDPTLLIHTGLCYAWENIFYWVKPLQLSGFSFLFCFYYNSYFIWIYIDLRMEKTLKSPLDWKEIKPVNPKGNQSWIFIEKTDAEAPILRLSDSKGWLLEKTLMLGKIEGMRRRWQHRIK